MARAPVESVAIAERRVAAEFEKSGTRGPTRVRGDMRDLLAGGLLLVFAAAVLLSIRGLAFGSITRPGPAAFPAVLAIILIGVAALVLVRGLRAAAQPFGAIAAKPLIAVTLAFVGFAVTVERAGLVPATVVLVVCAAFGFERLRRVETVLIAVSLSAFGALVFVWLLRLPLPLWRW
jgi:hypothetical protein